MTTSNQKWNLNNCTTEQLFKALSRVQAKLVATSVKDKNCKAHSIKHMSDMSEHCQCVIAADDSHRLTKLGRQSFKRWMPHHFAVTKDHWEENRIAPGRLLTAT